MFSFGLECSVDTFPTDNLRMHTVTVIRDIQWLCLLNGTVFGIILAPKICPHFYNWPRSFGSRELCRICRSRIWAADLDGILFGTDAAGNFRLNLQQFLWEVYIDRYDTKTRDAPVGSTQWLWMTHTDLITSLRGQVRAVYGKRADGKWLSTGHVK
jgi:hypothetical protein